jgi:hypothetical protein
MIYQSCQKNDPESWLIKLIKRRNINVAAGANKKARIVWTLLATTKASTNLITNIR